MNEWTGRGQIWRGATDGAARPWFEKVRAAGIEFLPGTRLIGAFIATLGMPQVSAVNEEMQRRMEARFGAGYAYTYLYPGLQKVVQAAGRVIRTTEDRGAVYLMDERFAQNNVRRLLPRWWQVEAGTAAQAFKLTAQP